MSVLDDLRERLYGHLTGAGWLSEKHLTEDLRAFEAALAERDRMLAEAWEDNDVLPFDQWLADLRRRVEELCPHCGKDVTVGIHDYCRPADATWRGVSDALRP